MVALLLLRRNSRDVSFRHYHSNFFLKFSFHSCLLPLFPAVGQFIEPLDLNIVPPSRYRISKLSSVETWKHANDHANERISRLDVKAIYYLLLLEDGYPNWVSLDLDWIHSSGKRKNRRADGFAGFPKLNFILNYISSDSDQTTTLLDLIYILPMNETNIQSIQLILFGPRWKWIRSVWLVDEFSYRCIGINNGPILNVGFPCLKVEF